MTVKNLHLAICAVAIFAIGLVLGGGIVERVVQTQWWTEKTSIEDLVHQQIKILQKDLKDASGKKLDELVSKIAAQKALEDIIIQNRTAKYSTIIPFTSTIIALIGLIGSLLTLVVNWLLGRRGGDDTSKSAA
jgi:hypothetical protein